jgi:8-oxo-dGTP pyrophosphatase MutT (NUDIX family)
MPKPELPRVGAIFLLRADGAALLQHRDDIPGLPHAGLWVPPGGHCEDGESLERCARREFEEETTYRCGSLTWLTTFDNLVVEDRAPFHLGVYWAVYDGAQTVQCLEGQALEFVDRGDASRYPIPGYLVDLWDRVLTDSQSVRAGIAGDRHNG